MLLSQIRFFLLQNRVGKTRLSKWYVAAADDKEKARIEAEIHRMVVSRDRKYTSFIEVSFASRGIQGSLDGICAFLSLFQNIASSCGQ